MFERRPPRVINLNLKKPNPYCVLRLNNALQMKLYYLYMPGCIFFSICYALYNNFLLSRKHYSYFAEYELQPSTWLGNFGGGVYRRDTSDEEWNTFSGMLNQPVNFMAQIKKIIALFFQKICSTLYHGSSSISLDLSY